MDDEITPKQFEWLQERAKAHRQRWASSLLEQPRATCGQQFTGASPARAEESRDLTPGQQAKD